MRKHIDWNQIKTRLNAAQAAIETTSLTDSKQVSEIYAARAARLASRQWKHTVDHNAFHGLSVLLNAERYIIELKDISEVVAVTTVTPVPGTPPEVTGLINLRGDFVTVVDLNRILEVPSTDRDGSVYLLILNRFEKSIGLKVDQVEKVIRLSASDLQSVGDAGYTNRYVKQVTRDNASILSMETLFSHAIFAMG